MLSLRFLALGLLALIAFGCDKSVTLPTATGASQIQRAKLPGRAMHANADPSTSP